MRQTIPTLPRVGGRHGADGGAHAVTPPGGRMAATGDLALTQGLGGRALLAERYDVLDVTGRLVRSVTRATAAEILAAGIADGIGRTSIKYLRLRVEVWGPSAARTWFGSAERGRVRPAAFRHNDRVCAGYVMPRGGGPDVGAASLPSPMATTGARTRASRSLGRLAG